MGRTGKASAAQAIREYGARREIGPTKLVVDARPVGRLAVQQACSAGSQPNVRPTRLARQGALSSFSAERPPLRGVPVGRAAARGVGAQLLRPGDQAPQRAKVAR